MSLTTATTSWIARVTIMASTRSLINMSSKLEARRPFSSSRPACIASAHTAMASASSSSASSSSTARSESSSRSPRRSARFTARPGADMVGPPDPISNLRPIRYGSAFEEGTSNSSASSDSTSSHAQTSDSQAALSMSHPYSLHEFTTSGDSSFGWSGSANTRRGAKSPSLYFERLLAKLEEAELAHKLRMARADNFNQRFWQDNNARFIQALSEFRSRTGSSKAVATLPAATEAEGKDAVTSSKQGQGLELDLDSDSLATFYSAWLKANAARHRAYNRQLWRQTFGDLAPAARYQCLRAWAKVVGSVERRLGRVN